MRVEYCAVMPVGAVSCTSEARGVACNVGVTDFDAAEVVSEEIGQDTEPREVREVLLLDGLQDIAAVEQSRAV